jgi:hypothetical protein
MAAGASRTTVLLLAAAVAVASFARPGAGDLKPDYYASTCPNVETIVRGVVQNKMQSTIRTIGSTIRLFFHDCFVEGCDGSVLIQSTPGNQAERDASDNLSLSFEGFETVRSAKAAVEDACPDTVSCADVLALAARDAIALVHIKRALLLIEYTQTVCHACHYVRCTEACAFGNESRRGINFALCFILCRAAGRSTRWSWAGWTG